MDLEKLKKDTQVIIDDVIKQTEIKAGQVFVLGLSSSEVNGGLIRSEEHTSELQSPWN